MAADPGRIVIVGAGPTGLGAAYRLEEIGFHNYVVIEASDQSGGLASSHRDAQGFTWDIGGHVGFSHYDYYDQVLDRALGDAWLWHERRSAIWLRERFVPYPFQLNLHRLDPADRAVALEGLERAAADRDRQPARTFADWIPATFGSGIAELFMAPYNRKVWGYPLESLNAGWIRERIALPDLDRVRRGIAEGRDDVSWGGNRRFRYPLEGGTGAVWKAVASLLPPATIEFGRSVTAIRTSDRTLTVSTGETVRFDTLVSTMPLDRLAAIADGLSMDARRAAGGLVHSAVHVIGVGLEGEQPEALKGMCWMYFPGAASPYYRVTVLSNYSPRNVPAVPGHWSLLAEIGETRHRPVDPRTVVDDVVGALRGDRLIGPDCRIVSVWHQRAEHGYPTPTLDRDERLGAIGPELEGYRIFSRGRFGAWKYEVSNQDHSFMQGVELANRLVHGEPETTVVNANGS